MDDPALLKSYADEASEGAFGELVARHAATVYSAARRQVGEPLAADVTQAVFLLLARKAAKLRGHTVLTAWLLTTTRLVCQATLRKEIRRQQREQEAAVMPNLEEQIEVESAWEQVQPMLDEALVTLSKSDRNLVVLRFFEQKSHAEIAVALGLSEEASKKRLSRAVERLRAFFSRRGVVLGAVALLAAISQNAIQAAPIGLASGITTTIASGTAGGMATALVNTTQKLMTWTKIKIAALCGTAALLVTVVPLVAMQPATNVVSDPDNRDARVERYLFQSAAARYKYPPSSPNPTEEVSRPEFPGEPLLSAEFSWKTNPAMPRVFAGRVIALDENGNGFDPIGNLMSGFVTDSSGRMFWVRDTPVFPRRGKEVRLLVMMNDGADHVLAEFKIPNPAPGPYPVWAPSQLPVTSRDNELEVTLEKFAAYQTSAEFTAKHIRYPRTECEFSLRENGRATTDWAPVAFEVSDATSNHWRPWRRNPFALADAGHVRSAFDSALWPGEAAWKLRVEFKRTANFPEAELLRISKIRIPDPNELSEPRISYTQNGVNIELAAVAGVDVPQNNREGPLVNVERTRGCISVVLTGPVVSQGRRMTFVEATDDQGRKIKLIGERGPATAGEEKFPMPFSFNLGPPAGAKELNLVVAVSQGRTVEFQAKPAQVLEDDGLR